MDALLERAIVWDNHACLPLRPHDERFLPQLERFRASGFNVVAVNVGFGPVNIETHLRMLAGFRQWLAARPDDYVLVRTIADIRTAKASGRLGVFFDIEGAGAVGDQLSLVQLYYDLGVRWMSLAYNVSNRAAGGCMEPDGGLTPFGVQLIAEMERTGMTVCCSHTGERSVLEAIELAKGPVIFSHSNPRALWDHPRNIRDHVILACAKRGGVIGINGVGIFLGPNDTRSETVARHIDYVAKLAGIDHVALGLDYVFDAEEAAEYVRQQPDVFGPAISAAGIASVQPEQIPEIVACLTALGYADADLERILGGNWLRIAANWK